MADKLTRDDDYLQEVINGYGQPTQGFAPALWQWMLNPHPDFMLGAELIQDIRNGNQQHWHQHNISNKHI